MTFIIHMGAPRTGTTVLQKHLFPKSKNYFVVQKLAYAPTGKIVDKEKWIAGGNLRQCISKLQSLAVPLAPDQATDFLNNLLIPPLFTPVDAAKRLFHQPLADAALSLGINVLVRTSQVLSKEIFISTERLCDTGASLRCYSRPTVAEFPIYPLLRAIHGNLEKQPLITICLRDPIKYLRSKFLRTFVMRRVAKERDLTPLEYIHKQCVLESNHPGTSVLAPAMHAEFIKQLQKYAFVKAFGFEELLSSDDVFSLMGLQGEGKYAFRDLTRENKLPVAEEKEKAIETEISQALRQYGFYDQIMNSQMFE